MLINYCILRDLKKNYIPVKFIVCCSTNQHEQFIAMLKEHFHQIKICRKSFLSCLHGFTSIYIVLFHGNLCANLSRDTREMHVMESTYGVSGFIYDPGFTVMHKS